MWEVFELLCEKRGVTTNAVAKATGVPQTTLSNWKKRRNLLNAKAAKKIADYFGVSLQFLMTGDGEAEIVRPSAEAANDIVLMIHENPVLIDMLYDFKDINASWEQRLKGYYDALRNNEWRKEQT